MEKNKNGNEVITAERATKDLAALLGCAPFKDRRDGHNCWAAPTTKHPNYMLYLDKRQTDYKTAERIVREYFQDKAIEDGGYRIRPSKLVFTVIEIGSQA